MIHIASTTSQSKLTSSNEDDVQPNAVDLRLDTVNRYVAPSSFRLGDTTKQLRAVLPVAVDIYGYYNLSVGSYQITFQNEIKVGAEEAGWVITRSTLLRNGVYIISGLYDSGYEGKMSALLVVTGGPAILQKGVRIGQYLCFNAETLHLYNGSYGVTANAHQ